jgi:hypothetical protein
MTWDFTFIDAVDPVVVGSYVLDAVSRYDEYKADAPRILAASRAAAKARSRKST